MHNLPDAHQRNRALNITQSFLVQAPAGSGKTELLTQRFLKLLAHVDMPEEIIAITFTKKAAYEMRARILASLKQPKTESAKNALQHSYQKNWNLQEYPNRLRILTLDALSLQIAKQLPISSKLGAQLTIADDPTGLYQHAVKTILLSSPKSAPWLKDIETLFLHLDNHYDRVEKLLIELLAKREQWLPLILNRKIQINQDYRKNLEKELTHVNDSALQKEGLLPLRIKAEMLALAEYAKSHYKISSTYSFSKKEYWIFIANMLLTKEGSLRKRADKTIGFPSASNSKNIQEKQIYDDYKQRYQALTQQLENHTAIIDWLIEIRHLPHTNYTETQWQVLDALLTLFPLMAAQLRLTFAQYNAVDYIENAQSALHALGDPEQPTDLSLRLDYKIQHLLVDEFQDTSNNQFQLLEKLTAGWTPEDGRTLFLVGDPMQSIYRFRQAEVSLFLHAKHHGIGDITLEFLALSSNFRSTPELITWINQVFKTVFPQQENMPLGAIPYSPAHSPGDRDSASPSAECLYFNEEDSAAEEDYLIEKIKYIKENSPHETLAILIRSRDQVQSIIPRLQSASIAYQAVDIESLSTKPIIYDLLSLTRACIHLADRVAWLACLRAPWCGLSLSDLWVIGHDSAEKTIWQQLNDEKVHCLLSDEGKIRIKHFSQTMRYAIQQRQRFSLRHIIEKVWAQLDGTLAYPQQTVLHDMQQFFTVLDNITDSHGVIQLNLLEKKIEKLFATTPVTQSNPVQIMTIHKSKGLEFDHVFLPKLQKKVMPPEKPLITWLEYSDNKNIYHLLIAPISEINSQNKTYDYIQQQQQQKLLLEMDRVFYVAVTRAKKNVYLTATMADSEKQANNRSLLGRLTTHHPNLFQEAQPRVKPSNIINKINEMRLLQRFPIEKLQKIFEINYQQEYLPYQENTPELIYPIVSLEAKIGTIIHQLIEQIAKESVAWWQTLSPKMINTIILALCMKENIATEKTMTKISQAITTMLHDPQGQWILRCHQNSWSEHTLFYYSNNAWQKYIIDRVLIDNHGIYWIIDYKTTEKKDATLSLNDFLAQAAAEHRTQLQRYYAALSEIVPPKKIRLALYFPLLPAWHIISL